MLFAKQVPPQEGQMGDTVGKDLVRLQLAVKVILIKYSLFLFNSNTKFKSFSSWQVQHPHFLRGCLCEKEDGFSLPLFSQICKPQFCVKI